MSRSLLQLSHCCLHREYSIKEARRGEAREKEVHVTCKGSFILKGKIGAEVGSWLDPIGSPENSHKSKRIVATHGELTAVVAIKATLVMKELAIILHVACFFPIKSMLGKAIKSENHTPLLVISALLVNQPPTSEAPTTQGRQHQRNHGEILTTSRVALEVVAI